MLEKECEKLQENADELGGRDTFPEEKNSNLEKEAVDFENENAIFEKSDDELENGEESEKSELEEIIQLVCTILDEISLDLENKRKRILYLTTQWEEHNRMLKKLEEAEDVAGSYFLPEGLNSNKKEQTVFRSGMDEIENLLFAVREEEKLREERRKKLKWLLRYLKIQENGIETAKKEEEESKNEIDDRHERINESQDIFELQESGEKAVDSEMNYSAMQIFSTVAHKIEFVNQLMGLDGMRAKIELLEIEEILKKAMREWKNKL